MGDNCYEVIFICPHANYYWTEESNLTLDQANNIVEIKNKYNLIHKYNGCCRYYVQLIGEYDL